MAEYQALYRKTRPEVFGEIIGQDHIVKILRHQIRTGTVSHAYLFCGTRGTGKTTTARILAKAVNCTGADPEHAPCGECPSCKQIAAGNFMDVIEIDAASNNGVDNIRELRESVKYPPSAGRKKVYIIDEVHMLSPGAFNALLKTLEEPPENVMFILATTNPEKIPQTVLSRCMRLDFHRVPVSALADHMREICAGRGVKITEDALRLLAVNADGSVRDSLSILEQCLSSGEPEITRDIALDFLGTVSEEFFLELTDKVMTRNISDAFLLLDRAVREGKDVRQLMRDWMNHCRSLLISKYVDRAEDMLNMSSDNIELLRAQAARIELPELNHAIVTLAKAIQDARYSTQPRILMEVAIVTISSGMEYGKSPANLVTAPAPRVPDAPASNAAPAPADSISTGRPPSGWSAPVSPAPAAAPGPQPAQPGPASAGPGPENQPLTDPGPASAGPGPENQPLPDPGATPRAGAQPSYTRQDLDEIWRTIFEEAERRSPKMTMMRNAVLADINDTGFKVIVASEIQKKLMATERDMVEELMEKDVGKHLSMQVRVQNAKEDSDEEEKREALAEKASKVLGIDVKIR